jgi:hypothetical protein
VTDRRLGNQPSATAVLPPSDFVNASLLQIQAAAPITGFCLTGPLATDPTIIFMNFRRLMSFAHHIELELLCITANHGSASSAKGISQFDP